ncbi:MIP/aquaporin family protein [Paeniglutamicibacter kerguelensis]|uniref:Glycerol uptake facilitator protein n=1 Tax=Paeniglutamicibacter kerguelensis TaxID=254788 RepID=A0ABS4XC80_9MICC|nr:MIP/aquaporin family protein [Paeniglutamicibacter kerguelensis]MBP2386070.1 glycerol uptake facilitator protein [Paeniglutamicibacter kerguelensis]
MSLNAFIAEMLGTMLLLLMGGGVVANVVLAKSKGLGGGFLMINWGWGLAVFSGVFIAAASGAHLNPAVTVGLWVNPDVPEFGPGIPKTFIVVLMYWTAQMLGAMIGAVLCYLAYKQHFDAEEDAGLKLAVFSTGPAIRSYGWNLVTEIIGTFVLVFVIAGLGKTPHQLGPLAVALLVVGIGASLGGPTGYAINPARDLGPRIIHALLPIKGKGSSDWSYSWVPVVGPLIGGVIGGLSAAVLF